MGHTFPIAISHQKFNPKSSTICIDGDGSFYMHLGSFALLKNFKLNRMKYILLDNNSHESIGGQLIDFKLNVEKFSAAVGFTKYYLLKDQKKINFTINNFLKSKNTSFFACKN